jgi:hypothetical protein
MMPRRRTMVCRGRIMAWQRLAEAWGKGRVHRTPCGSLNLSLYIFVGFEKEAALMKKLGKHSTGKGCLYIKRLSDADLKVLEELIVKGVKTMEKVRVRQGACHEAWDQPVSVRTCGSSRDLLFLQFHRSNMDR